MTHGEIESFLAVCRHKNMTKAAESLFISQSSLSIRIKTLERELGGALFCRRQGCRELSLTAAGTEFYKLALEYISITERMKRVCARTRRSLRVSAINSLSAYVLPEVCRRFLRQYPDVELSVQDMELEAASHSICQGHTDIAFTAGNTADVRLTQNHAFSEPMVLLAHNLSGKVSKQMLSVRDEVYVAWSSHFVRWHQKTFGADAQPRVSIAVMEQLKSFLEEGGCWAIVPVSVAIHLEKTMPLKRVETDFSLPRREISYVTAAEPTNPETAALFLECLQQSLVGIEIVAEAAPAAQDTVVCQKTTGIF